MNAHDLGIDELATYTLGDSVDYQPYELTRRFYREKVPKSDRQLQATEQLVLKYCRILT